MADDELITSIVIEGTDTIEADLSHLGGTAEHAFGQMSKAAQGASGYLDQLSKKIAETSKAAQSAGQGAAGGGLFDGLIAKVKEAGEGLEAFRSKFGGQLFAGAAASSKEAETNIKAVGSAVSQVAAQGANLATIVGPGFGVVARGATEAASAIVSSASSLTTFAGALTAITAVGVSFVGITAGLIAIAKSSADAVRGMSDLAETMGTTIEQASALTQALRERGADTDQFGTAMSRLSQTISRAWEEIQTKTQTFASQFQAALLRARDATLALQQAQINTQFFDREQSSERVRNSLAVQGAVLGLAAAELNLQRIRSGGIADPFTEGRLEALRAIQQVEEARQALVDAELKKQKDLEETTLRRAQLLEAQAKAQKEVNDAAEAGARLLAESVPAAIELVRNLAAGGTGEIVKSFEGASIQVPKTVENIMRGIIAAIGPATKQVQTLGGSLIDLASAPPKVKEAFFFILDVLKGIDDEALRTSIAIRAFGRSVGPELARQALEGSAPIKARIQELEDLGIVLTKDEKIISSTFTQAWQRLIGLISSLGIKAGVTFQEPFIAAFNQISDALTKNKGQFLAWAQSIADLVKVVVAGLVAAFTGIDISKSLNLSPEQVLKANEWRRTFEEIGSAARFFGEVIATVFRAIVAVVAVLERAFETFARGLNNLFNTDFFTASGVAVSAWAALIIARLGAVALAFVGLSATAVASLGLLLATLAVVTAAVLTLAAALPDAITQVSLIAQLWQAAAASGQSMGAALLILNQIFQEHKNLSRDAKQAMANLIQEFIRSGGVINGVKVSMEDLVRMLQKLAEEADKTKITPATPTTDPAATDAQKKAEAEAKVAAEAAAAAQRKLDLELQRLRDQMAGTAPGVSQGYKDMADAGARSASSQINSASGIGAALARLKNIQRDLSIDSANLSVAEARYRLQVLTGEREADAEVEHGFEVRRAQLALREAIARRDQLIMEKRAEQEREAGRQSAAAGDEAKKAADVNFAASKKITVGADGIKESYLGKNKVLKDQQALENAPANSGPTEQRVNDAAKIAEAQRERLRVEQEVNRGSTKSAEDTARRQKEIEADRQAAIRSGQETDRQMIERSNQALRDAAAARKKAAEEEKKAADDTTTQAARDAAIEEGRKKAALEAAEAAKVRAEAVRKQNEADAAAAEASKKAADDEAASQKKILDIIEDTIRKLEEKKTLEEQPVPTPAPRPPGAPGGEPIPIDPNQFVADAGTANQALESIAQTADKVAAEVNTDFGNIDVGTDIEQGSQDAKDAISGLVSDASDAAQGVSDALSDVQFDPGQISGSFDGLVSDASQAASEMNNAFQSVDLASGINTQIDSIESNLGQLDSSVQNTQTAFQDFGGSGLLGDVSTNALGGLFRGRPGTDTNLAWLSDFEYIMRPEAVRRYGVDFMHMINSMQFPGYRAGGLNLKTPAYVAGGAARAQNTRTMHITIGDQTFRNLVAPENTAKQLERAAISRQSSSTGVRPRWSR